MLLKKVLLSVNFVIFKIFSRGHGTYLEDECLHASVAGTVERVNKLVSVRPLKTRSVDSSSTNYLPTYGRTPTNYFIYSLNNFLILKTYSVH